MKRNPRIPVNQEIIRNTGVQHREDDVSRIAPRMGQPQYPGTSQMPPVDNGVPDACCGATRMLVWRGPVGLTSIPIDWQGFGTSIMVRVTNFSPVFLVEHEPPPTPATAEIKQSAIGIAFGGAPASDPTANPSGTLIATARIGGFSQNPTVWTGFDEWDYPHRDFPVQDIRAAVVCSGTDGIAEVVIFFP